MREREERKEPTPSLGDDTVIPRRYTSPLCATYRTRCRNEARRHVSIYTHTPTHTDFTFIYTLSLRAVGSPRKYHDGMQSGGRKVGDRR